MSQLSLNLGTITEGGRNETETGETSSKIVSSGHDRNMAPTNPHQLHLTAHASQQARMQWEGALTLNCESWAVDGFLGRESQFH